MRLKRLVSFAFFALLVSASWTDAQGPSKLNADTFTGLELRVMSKSGCLPIPTIPTLHHYRRCVVP